MLGRRGQILSFSTYSSPAERWPHDLAMMAGSTEILIVVEGIVIRDAATATGEIEADVSDRWIDYYWPTYFLVSAEKWLNFHGLLRNRKK